MVMSTQVATISEEQKKNTSISPEDIDRRVCEAQALATSVPPSTMLRNLLDVLKGEDQTLADACASASEKIQRCFSSSKAVGKKTESLKQSITERHFEAGEELERMAWLLRGCFEIWQKTEKFPATTSYRARALYKAAKHVDAVKGLTLVQAYKKFGILQPKQPSLDKLLVSLEKHIQRVSECGICPADELETSNCSATITRCQQTLETFSASICAPVVTADAIAAPPLKKIAAKKKPKVAQKQLGH